VCTIEFRSNVGDRKGPTLQVTTDYKRFSKVETIEHSGAHINNVVSYQPKGRRRPRAKDKLANSDAVIAALRSLGDFGAKFYWYNRGRIRRYQPELWSSLEGFVRTWSGGLLVYRDGFRVYPYGSPSDDWLDLDRTALAGSAFKLNRAQIVGYLRISTRTNPRLQDQTNREGFRDCPEKEALRRLLRQAIISDCRTYLEKIDKDESPADEAELEAIETRVVSNYAQARENLSGLQRRVPDESSVISSVLAQLQEVNDAWERAKEALSAHEAEIEQYIHLAGVGLMVELIAHELARSTDMALEILDDKNLTSNSGKLESLQAQLKTINKRVRVLDELSIPGRQRKTGCNIVELANLIKELYEFKAHRHGVDISVVKKGKGGLIRRAEKGQILQILDNLLSNSMYWLNRRLDRKAVPSIVIEVDTETSTVRVIDNGPGIPTGIGARVFDAFFTTKPSGEGRGLGLYIARRLAMDNDADLSLIEPEGDCHAGFQLSFRGAATK
jgi:signal transduction histidine kinase